MTKPWRKAMPGVVLHGAHLRRSPEGIRHPLGGALVIGRKSDADMAIVEDRVIRPVGTFELVQDLRDQETADAVVCHESKLALEEVKAAKRGELIDNQQEPVPPPVGI